MKCWCTIPTPAAIAVGVLHPVTVAQRAVAPATSIVPAVGANMPASRRMSVLLPAPFSPTRRGSRRPAPRARVAHGVHGAEALGHAAHAHGERARVAHVDRASAARRSSRRRPRRRPRRRALRRHGDPPGDDRVLERGEARAHGGGDEGAVVRVVHVAHAPLLEPELADAAGGTCPP
jgi:hypothetical protein